VKTSHSDIELDAVAKSAPDTMIASGLDVTPRQQGDGPAEGEVQRIEQFSREQFRLIREAREALLAEKQEQDKAAQLRRQDLDQRAKLIDTLMSNLHERERRLTEQMEEAIVERAPITPKRDLTDELEDADWVDIEELSTIHQMKTMRQQMSDQKAALERALAERDDALERLSQLQQVQHECAIATPVAEEVNHELEQARTELNQAHAQVAELRADVDRREQERIRQEKHNAKREKALVVLQELVERHLQFDDKEEQLKAAIAERDAALARIEVIRPRLGELEQVRSERDAAYQALRQREPEPEGWDSKEIEFAALRRQVEEEKRQLGLEARDLHLHAEDMQKKLEETRNAVIAERALVQQQSEELAVAQTALAEEQRKCREQEDDLRLRESELIEMKEIIEQETAHDRAQLVQERVRIARLREFLKMELQSNSQASLLRPSQELPSSGQPD
jgi:hypothetical protein